MIDSTLKTACELLERGQKFVLASIIRHQGATPRRTGTKMLISGGGKSVGTIGGGLLEADVIKASREMLSGDAASTFIHFDLTHQNTASMDMICGGKVTVLLDMITPSPASRDAFAGWRRALESRENGYFVTVILGSRPKVDRISHGMVDRNGDLHGEIPLSSGTMEKIAVTAQSSYAMSVMELGEALVIVEPAIRPRAAFFFGAGHVAQPTVHLAALTGFWTAVLDDRVDFANRERFPDADEIHVLDDFADAFGPVSIDADALVVIFTRGHIHDRTVLSQALKTNAGYIGMIGSRRKRDLIYQALLDTGFTSNDIARVHSPIGLDIGAETPAEIAISIVGELIAHRGKGWYRRNQ